jgi:hypothetical protein
MGMAALADPAALACLLMSYQPSLGPDLKHLNAALCVPERPERKLLCHRSRRKFLPRRRLAAKEPLNSEAPW